MQIPAFPLPIHSRGIMVVLPLVWVFVVVAGFLCFGSLFEGVCLFLRVFFRFFCC